jgi:hypothetical protein
MAKRLPCATAGFPPSHPRIQPGADQTSGEHDPIPEIGESRPANFRAPIVEAVTGSSGSKCRSSLQSAGSHRTSFTPETIPSENDEYDQSSMKTPQNQQSRPLPPARNGLVAGSM